MPPLRRFLPRALGLLALIVTLRFGIQACYPPAGPAIRPTDPCQVPTDQPLPPNCPK
jgi:hypothetical protein